MGATGGFGVTLYIGDGDLSSTPDYTAIAKVQDVGDLKSSLVMAETTAHDASGGYYDAIPTGKRKIDPTSLTLVFDPDQATHQNASGGIEYAHHQQTKLAFKVRWPDDSSYFACDAYVESFTWQAKQTDKWTAVAVLHWVGTPTWYEA